MFGRTQASAALVAFALTVSVGCSGSGGNALGASAPVGTGPPTTAATTAATHPSTVPPAFDIAEVSKVIAGLDAAVGDVTRLVVRTRTISEEALQRIEALYDGGWAMQIVLSGFQADMRQNFAGYGPNPGNKRSTVTKIISATPSCIFVRVERDYTGVSPGAFATADVQWVGLKPLDASRDPRGLNQTGWAFFYEGFPPDRSEPKDQCMQ